MNKKLSVIALSALVLAACDMTGTVSGDVDVDATASAGATMSAAQASAAMSAEADADVDAAAALTVWAPDLQWSAAVAGTNDSLIVIDVDHEIPAGMIQAEDTKANLTAEQYLMIFQDGSSRAKLDAELAKDGWTPHASLDADGATGTQWGYTKNGPEGQQFLVVSANGTNCTGTPATCTTYEGKVSVTSALAEGDDL